MEISLIALFLMALSMSFSHCIGMCGGIVIAYSSSKIHKNQSRFYQISSHMLYNLGRISSYAFIGVFSAFVGYKISASVPTKGILFIVVGIFLILFAILYVFFPKFISHIEPSLPKNPKNMLSQSFKKFFVYLIGSQSFISFYGLGILNGFLPCGMVYFFAGYAITAPNPFMGGIMMVIFGFATVFPLFILGFFTGKINTSAFRNIFLKISFILMICFGGMSIYKGILILEGKPHSMNHQMNMNSSHHHSTHHMEM
ncbi:hypothetical protein BKH42_04030 [Helicobacter sp. 13S00482-2]|uniref:sulfite exporter TauE/SafE family protein n=1 Tax=Helicobacter sp. 13S00482-2 TaxID=1476200 RepID=UPI000BA64FE8|nr:sulfite exporter TauE/SafE family protein [Helicobacter sp. 13S00482-2]PAF53909.1 hypothetical protein BKH42_04030 [Helicobacter sp. 13S00482-2]